MTPGFRLLPFLSSLLLVAACTSSTPQATTTDTAPIADVRNRYVAAYNAGDAAGVAALFAEDAISLPDHAPAINGRAASENSLKEMFAKNTANITITPGETEIVGDIAHEHGSYSITVTPKAGGNAMTDTGKYLVILKRGSDGKWLVHHDIDNTNAPPTPPAAPAPAPAPAK
jgi:uncharacterized protein (TIGR02246 family)